MVSRSLSLLMLLGLLTAMVLPGTTQAVHAQDEATPSTESGATQEVLFSVRPENGGDGQPFEVELQPGESANLVVVLGNAGNIPVELLSYTANVLTNPNGGMGIDEEDVEHVPPTTWMEFPSQLDPLAPGQEVTRTLSITVPEGTLPGQYVNAIAVQTVDDYAIEGSTNFRQRVRKVSAVYVNVPGELQASFTLRQPEVEFRTRGPVLQIPVENTGNTWIRPYGEMVLSDMTGVELVRAPVVMGTVFAGHSTLMEVRMNVALLAGEYLLTVDLADDRSEATASLTEVTFVMPEPEVEGPPDPVTLQSITVTPNAEPVQFATIAVELANQGDSIGSARLTISVSRGGEFVEDFILANSLVVSPGITTVEQRYIPLTGFESGTYTFSVKLESINPNTGVAEVVMIQEDVATLEVP